MGKDVHLHLPVGEGMATTMDFAVGSEVVAASNGSDVQPRAATDSRRPLHGFSAVVKG